MIPGNFRIALASILVAMYNNYSKTVAAFALRDYSQTDLDNVKMESNALYLPGGNAVWDSRTGRVKPGNADALNPIPAISAYGSPG